MAHRVGDRDVEQHADGADALGRHAEQPVVRRVRRRVHELEVDDVAGGEDNTSDHPGDGARHVGALVEDAEDDGREERGRRQPEGEGHHLRDESGWIDPQVAGDADRRRRRHARGEQLLFLRDLPEDHLLHQVVGDRRGDHQQQPGRRGQRRGEAAGRDECDHPGRQVGDLGVGQHHDVVVDLLHLVARVLGIEHAPILVLVFPDDEPGLLPVLDPARRLRVEHALAVRTVDGLDHVGAGEGGDGRGRGVEQGDEEQRPQGRLARVLDLGHGEEAHDHVRQAGGADHQRRGDAEHVECSLDARGIGVEAQLDVQAVELVQQVGAVAQGRAETHLRDDVAGHQQGDEDRRHQVGEDQHAVLGHLGIGDALHAAEHGVEEHDRHADDHAGVDVHLEEAREHDADAAHLPGDVGE